MNTWLSDLEANKARIIADRARTAVEAMPWDAPVLAMPARATSEDYRLAVGLPPARGGDDPAVPIRVVRVAQGAYRVACLRCRVQSGAMGWAGANNAAITHRCRHVREDLAG